MVSNASRCLCFVWGGDGHLHGRYCNVGGGLGLRESIGRGFVGRVLDGRLRFVRALRFFAGGLFDIKARSNSRGLRLPAQ